MGRFKLVGGFFRHTSLKHWPGLAWYLLGWLMYRLTGVRLFRERRLHFKPFAVVASVEGLSGLVFLHEVLVRDAYRIPEVDSDRRIRTVFDVGANCGFFALTQASRHPEWRFCCLEPHPNSFAHLEKNIAANRLGARTALVQACGGAKSGTCLINVSAESSMAVVVGSAAQEQCLEAPTPRPAQVCTLDEVSAREHLQPDFLKIDVEGFEVEVLKGATACLNTARYVVLEYHSGKLGDECRRILEAVGFKVRQDGGLMVAAHPRLNKARGHVSRSSEKELKSVAVANEAEQFPVRADLHPA